MSVETAFKELESAAAELDEQIDELNELIERFENTLQHRGLGITYWYNRQFAGVNKQDAWYVGYAKLDGDWRFAVRQGRGHAAIALLKAPRYVRVDAICHLENLMHELAAEARQQTTSIQQSNALYATLKIPEEDKQPDSPGMDWNWQELVKQLELAGREISKAKR